MELHFTRRLIILIITIAGITGCQKKLDIKPDKTLAFPTSKAELQGVLDQGLMYTYYPCIGQISDDNYYVTDANYNSNTDINKKGYIWDANGQYPDDWSRPYTVVLNSNVVLNAAQSINISSNTEKNEYDFITGSAKFYRAFAFYEIAQIFAPPYIAATANLVPGIPLKENPEAEDNAERATLFQTYAHIIKDLKEAAPLLPDIQVLSEFKSRPSKAACYGMLARTYLAMGNYDSAAPYAHSCLSLYNTILDYNSSDVNPAASTPIKKLNGEIIFYAMARSNSNNSRQLVDSALYASFNKNDLRKTAWFKVSGAGYTFKGSYSQLISTQFIGITTAEMLLISAECSARAGNTADSWDNINSLLRNRWKTDSFVPYQTNSAESPLAVSLQERRKELIFRGSLRWTDLRRLNFSATTEQGIYPVRLIGGENYTLGRNDLRYTLLIPQIVIDLSNKKITQNER